MNPFDMTVDIDIDLASVSGGMSMDETQIYVVLEKQLARTTVATSAALAEMEAQDRADTEAISGALESALSLLAAAHTEILEEMTAKLQEVLPSSYMVIEGTQYTYEFARRKSHPVLVLKEVVEE